MLEKFDGDSLNKSVEVDAQSAESNEFRILDDVDKDDGDDNVPQVLAPSESNPIIKDEPAQKLQTAPEPDQSNVLLQQRCQNVIDELNAVNHNKQPESDPKSAFIEEVVDKDDNIDTG
jgi:hypothetical protein